MAKIVYITPREVADILEWTKDDVANGTRKALRWLRGAGALVKRGNRWVTTKELLRKSFPEVYEEIEIERLMRDEG